ncbi:hypothetical protein PABG_11812 [Paracoccidioides brasiliensis Pb03]|nr:hypothetical protein PABG_11812 [Paracoccidioides brasiliensis Pb03]
MGSQCQTPPKLQPTQPTSGHPSSIQSGKMLSVNLTRSYPHHVKQAAAFYPHEGFLSPLDILAVTLETASCEECDDGQGFWSPKSTDHHRRSRISFLDESFMTETDN